MAPKLKRTRIAAYGLVLKDNKILLCKISKQFPKAAGFWTLPGGGLEFGEDPADTVVREVEEETGLLIKPLSVAGIDSFTQEDNDHAFHGIRILYHTELLGGELRYEKDGSTDLCEWWTYKEALNLPLVSLVSAGLSLAFPNLSE